MSFSRIFLLTCGICLIVGCSSTKYGVSKSEWHDLTPREKQQLAAAESVNAGKDGQTQSDGSIMGWLKAGAHHQEEVDANPNSPENLMNMNNQ